MGEVDAPKLAWALSNVVLLAMRSSPRGTKLTLSVRQSSAASGTEYVEFLLHHDGASGSCLMDAAEQARALGPKGTTYDLRVGRTEPTGSALSIARQIAELHGGRLLVCGDPGMGSDFQLKIPKHEQQRMANG